MTRERDSKGRFVGPKEPDPGPLWIEAPIDRQSWGEPNSCNVVDIRQPMPDPHSEEGKGFAVVFTGTFDECDAFLEASAC